jgi:MerR HTH family regulatory protein
MEEQRWTLDELAERVDAALAVDYHGQPSGRVRAVPDRRAIRWYTTIGLIDRPVAHRGRTALYGPRHLLQLVAVKRLQAQGLPLVSIQRELAGATDIQLARVARLPADPAPVPSGAGQARQRRVTAAGRDPGAGRARGAGPAATPPHSTVEAGEAAGFWRRQPVAFMAAAFQADPTAPMRSPDPDPDPTPLVSTLQGVRLGDGATLLLEGGRELEVGDLDAVLDAARPLLAVLADRGLGRGPAAPDRLAGRRRAGRAEPRREPS